MPFAKGQSGNKAGKPKGAVNKTTIDLRQWITGFIEDNRDQIRKDWLKLKPKERVILFEKLLKYSLPALQATSLEINFEKLTDEQLDQITERLMKLIKNEKQ